MKSFSHLASSKIKANLEKVSSSEARSFLLKNGYNSSSLVLPEYYQPKGFERIKLSRPSWAGQGPNKLKRTIPLYIDAPKGNNGWRRYSILHPYSFWHIVNTMTESSNWDLMKNKLLRSSSVASYSVPKLVSVGTETSQGSSITSWLQFAESDLVKDSPGYSHMAITDIRNFYPSIYTHSLAWALHGKSISRAQPRNLSLFGNQLDKVFQNSREGQTNGIPIGSMVSDIAAELILTEVDEKISEKVRKAKILASRYRDDYRFLCKSEKDAREIAAELSRVLHDDFNLVINSDKTKIYDNIVEGAFRPWDRAINNSATLNKFTFPNKLRGGFLKDYLIETYSLQREYPEGRPGVMLLARLNRGIEDNAVKIFEPRAQDIEDCVGLLLLLMTLREDTTVHAVRLLDVLLNLQGLYSNSAIKNTIKKAHHEFMADKNRRFQEVWLHRLCLRHYPEYSKKMALVSNNKLIMMLESGRDNIDFYDSIDPLVSAERAQLLPFKFVDQKIYESVKNNNLPLPSFDTFASGYGN